MSLKKALELDEKQLEELKSSLNKKAKEKNELGAYIEQFSQAKLTDGGPGVPIAIKDNISVKNWPLTCASKILQGYISPYDASAIKNLKKNGFAPFGRTNMDEFAMGSSGASSYYGKTLNPHDKSLIPGGSSSGSAAAVASGLALAALGSDTGGSVRQPAAFCACVGFKPSYGRVSRYGLAAYSSSLDQIGILSQSVEDAALLYDAIKGYDELDSTSANISYTASVLNTDKKYKIAVIKNYIDSCEKEVKDGLLKAAKALEKEGHELNYINMPDAKYDVAAYYIIACAEASTNLSRYDGVRYGYRSKNYKNLKELYINTRSEGFGSEVKRRILLGTFVLSSGYYDAYYLKAVRARALVKARYDKILSTNDAILAPIAPTKAYGFGLKKELKQIYLEDAYSIGANLASLPAITVPLGGFVSAQLLAKQYDEDTLLSLALLVQNLKQGFK